MTVRMKRVAAIAIVLFIGASGFILRAQVLQPVGSWTPAGELADIRSGGASVALDDGRTLIAGGANAEGTPTDRVAIVDAPSGALIAAGRLLHAREGHTATLVGNGRVLVIGGSVEGAATADVELFDVETGASTVIGTLTQARTGHAAARLPNGTVLIVGGAGADGAVVATAEAFDPETGSAVALASHLEHRRAGASATALIDGRVLVAGGNDGTRDLSSAEIYEPASRTFSLLDTGLSVARSGHAALLLPHNNGVLIAGGRSNGVPQTATDLFLPAEFPDPYSYGTGTFAPTSALANARAGALAGPGHAEGFAFVTGGGSDDEEKYRFATIRTDKDDYAPGERAVITGTGWRPGEVRLLFQEDPPVHDDYVLTVTADAAGNIYWDEWAPEQHDLGVRFYLMASDSVSKAQTTFTDALGTSTTISSSLNPSLTGQNVTFTATVTQTGQGGGTAGTAVTVGTLSFRQGGTNCNNATAITGNLTLNASGQATATSSFPTAGTFIIRACYNGTGGSAGTQNSDASLSQVVNAANTAPTVTLTGDASANEGTTKSYSFSVIDPDSGETFSLLDASCGANGTKSGETFTASTGAGSFSCTFPDGPASSIVSVEVSDGDASDTDTITVTIANVAPAVVLSGDNTADEGQTKTYTYTVTDPGDDPNPTITESCGAAGTRTDTAAPNSFDCTFPDGPASSNVTVAANDNDPANNLGTATIAVTIANVAPTVTLSGDTTANEGQTKTYTYTVSDPGDDPNPTITESCGAAGTRTDTPAPNSFDCTFPDGPASSDVTVTANDNDPANNIGTATIAVAIANVAPTVILSGANTADEGQTKTYTYTVTDPGNDPNPTITESCGTAGTRTDTPAPNSFDCTFPDGPATSEVKVTADDGDPTNNIGSAAIVVNVANAPPAVNAGADGTVDEGTAFVQAGSFADPGADSWTATVNYGDGSGVQALPLNANKTFSLNHTYGDNGTFTITVTVTDDDGGVGVDSVIVTVNNVAPALGASAFTLNPYTGAASAAITFSDQGWLDRVSSIFNWAGQVVSPGDPAFIGPVSAPPLTGTFTSSHLFAPGCITAGIGVAVTDDDLGQSGFTFANPNTLQVYSVAFLAPLKDGMRNVAKLGNVIPVKLSILDCNGNPVINKTLSITVVAGIINPGDVIDGDEIIPASVSAADTAGVMRLADSHYMYNMATKGLSTGLPYTIVIRDGAMVAVTAVVELKK